MKYSVGRVGIRVPILAALAMVLALLTTPASAATGDGPGVKIAGSGDAQEAATGVVTGFIVADPPGKGGVNTEAVLARAEATLGVALAPGHGIGFGLSTVKLAQPVTVAQAEQMSARWKASGQVSQVQPDYPTFLADASTGASDVSTQAVQGSAPWGLDRIDQRSGLDGRYSPPAPVSESRRMCSIPGSGPAIRNSAVGCWGLRHLRRAGFG